MELDPVRIGENRDVFSEPGMKFCDGIVAGSDAPAAYRAAYIGSALTRSRNCEAYAAPRRQYRCGSVDICSPQLSLPPQGRNF